MLRYFLFLSLWLLGQTSFVAEKGNLTVDFPPENKTSFEVYLADYGLPHYGAKITAELVYLGQEAQQHSYSCVGEPDSEWNGLDCKYGCNDLTKATPALNLTKWKEADWGSNHYFLVVDRGPYKEIGYNTCNFLKKTLNAQKAGADGLIVLSNSNRETTMETPDDDSSYAMELNVSIGSVLMKKKDGDIIRELLSVHKGHVPQPVIVTLDFSNLFTEEKKVKYEIWRDSNDACGSHCEQQKYFLQIFSAIANGLQADGYVEFEPHYIIWQCPETYRQTEECQQQCINKGRYCISDPDSSDLAGYTGKDVVLENYRELCVHKIGMENGLPSLWWDYIATFLQRCQMADSNFNEDCAISTFQSATGEDSELLRKWRQCYGDADKDEENELLEQEIKLQMGEGKGESQVLMNPTIRINGGQYRGSLSIVHVMKALCSAFEDGLEPSICNLVAKSDCQLSLEGAKTCQSEFHKDHGTTYCKETFMGYECGCEEGFVAANQNDEIFCHDINECLSLNTGCDCERCVCINTKGGFKCERDVQNPCEESHNGGCWHEKIEGVMYSACLDNIENYKQSALQGNPIENLSVCQCPPCFNSTSDGFGCQQICYLSFCDPQTGFCQQPEKIAAAGANGASSPAGVIVFVVISILVIISMVIFVVIYKRQTTKQEVRNIMKMYMKLPDQPEQSMPQKLPSVSLEHENILGPTPMRSDSAAKWDA